MPKKPTTTREDMTEGAFQLIRKSGQEAFSARNLAAFLGCSTQPIMYQFPNLEELRDLAYRRADGFHTEYIMSGGSLLDIGMNYIRFGSVRKRLRLFWRLQEMKRDWIRKGSWRISNRFTWRSMDMQAL